MGGRDYDVGSPRDDQFRPQGRQTRAAGEADSSTAISAGKISSWLSRSDRRSAFQASRSTSITTSSFSKVRLRSVFLVRSTDSERSVWIVVWITATWMVSSPLNSCGVLVRSSAEHITDPLLDRNVAMSVDVVRQRPPGRYGLWSVLYHVSRLLLGRVLAGRTRAFG